MLSLTPSILRTPPSPFDRPHLFHTILTQPLHLLLRLTSYFLTLLRPIPSSPHLPIRVVCISDTHSLDPGPIPDGDILIHAGDITAHGTPAELQTAINHLSSLPHQHKFIIAGNHDTYLDPASRTTLSETDLSQKNLPINWNTLTYLQHNSTTIKLKNRTLHIHGSPQTPLPVDPSFAFTYQSTLDAWRDTIPPETDILITHSPPKHHLDLPIGMGCPFLTTEVSRVKPLLHVFGHVHAGRSDFEGWVKGGRERVMWDGGEAIARKGLGRQARGLLLDVLNLGLWWDLGRVVALGVQAVVWERVWGGRGLEASTVMINAAMMYEGSGRLGNGVQVVDI